MVRIVNEEQPQVIQPIPEQSLSEKSQLLLQVIGVVIADKPEAIRDLLNDYSVSFDGEPSETELVDTLLLAIGEYDPDFNGDLASIILDCTLDSSYDSFDLKSVFKKKDGEAKADNSAASGNNAGGGGLWAGIANAVGGIGNAIGQGIKGKQAKDQATTNTIQGIYAYRTQQAANAQSKGKNNTYILIAICVVVGLAVTALLYFNSKPKAPQPIKPITP